MGSRAKPLLMKIGGERDAPPNSPRYAFPPYAAPRRIVAVSFRDQDVFLECTTSGLAPLRVSTVSLSWFFAAQRAYR
jgi:hypothetical protein